MPIIPPEQDIARLLLSLFDIPGLQRFLSWTGRGELLQELPSGAVIPEEFVFRLVRNLKMRGDLTISFFDELVAQRPRRCVEIREIQKRLLCPPELVQSPHNEPQRPPPNSNCVAFRISPDNILPTLYGRLAPTLPTSLREEIRDVEVLMQRIEKLPNDAPHIIIGEIEGAVQVQAKPFFVVTGGHSRPSLILGKPWPRRVLYYPFSYIGASSFLEISPVVQRGGHLGLQVQLRRREHLLCVLQVALLRN